MRIEELSLSALKYFVDAVELGSLTLSAERNHVTRPAVSQAVKRLEEWRGSSLVHHRKREFELTEEGIEFYQLARRALGRFQTDLDEATALSNALKLGVSASVLEFVLPRLRKHFEKAELSSLRVGTTRQLLEWLGDGSIHLALAVDGGAAHDFETELVHSGDFQFRSPTGALGDRIVTTEERPEVTSFLKMAHGKKLSFRSHIRVESWTVAQRLAEARLGSCLVPDFLPKGKLRAVPLSGWKAHYQIVLWLKYRHELSAIERRIVDDLSPPF